MSLPRKLIAMRALALVGAVPRLHFRSLASRYVKDGGVGKSKALCPVSIFVAWSASTTATNGMVDCQAIVGSGYTRGRYGGSSLPRYGRSGTLSSGGTS